MNSRIVSVVSLAVILALLGIIGYLVYGMRLGTPEAAPAQTSYVTNTVRQIAVRKINPTNLFNLANRLANWSGLESTNYQVYVANLRAFGCPEETVQDIIISDVARVYAKKREDLRRQYPPRKFWQTDYSAGGGGNPELRQRLQALREEQRALIRELLGINLDSALARYSEDSQPGRDYEFLPAEKRDQVQALNLKYDELENELFERTHGMMLDADEEMLKALQQQREAELAQVLSPGELEEYQLRHSPVAEELRSQLTGFTANEEEFRKLFKIHQQYDQQMNAAFDVTDDAQWETRARAEEEAQRALQEETRRILGDQRFAEMQRTQDPDYRALVQMTDRFGMPKETVNKVFEMKLAAETQKQLLESNPDLTEEQRQAGLTAVARATERAVAEAFNDPKIYKSYRKAAGQWIQNLSEADFVPPAEEMAE